MKTLLHRLEYAMRQGTPKRPFNEMKKALKKRPVQETQIKIRRLDMSRLAVTRYISDEIHPTHSTTNLSRSLLGVSLLVSFHVEDSI